MGKRTSEYIEGDIANLKNGERAGSTARLGQATTPIKDGIGEFEDPYEDEMESDEEIIDADNDQDDDGDDVEVVEEEEDEDEGRWCLESDSVIR